MKSILCESENQTGSELLQVFEVSHKSWSLTIRSIIKRLQPSKPDYNPSAILQNQMDTAVALYDKEEHPSLQTIADELDINPIKVRKLLITAGVYKSDAADQVQRVFNKHRDSGLSHTEAIAATMKELNLSKASVTSYLPYEKGVYFPAETDNKNLSVGAERIRRMRKRNKVLETLLNEQSEEALWTAMIEFQGYKFRTYSGLVFSYSLKKGRGDTYTNPSSPRFLYIRSSWSPSENRCVVQEGRGAGILFQRGYSA